MRNGEPMFTLLLGGSILLVATAYGGWDVQVTSPRNMEVAIHDPFRWDAPEFARL